ncbi:MAG: hypothetical protein SNG02_05545 [Rikenellaceae bacterium]
MFTKEPEALASFRDELIFEYAQEGSDELTFEIELEGSGSSQEIKKLYGVSSASINVAPYVANKFMTTPSSGESALTTPDCGYAQVTLKCGNDSSSTQYFVASKVELPEEGMISSLPASRFIGYGEADEIWIHAPEGSQVEATVECTDEGGVTSSTFSHTAQECGFVRFRFNTSDFSPYTKMAKVTITCGGEAIAEVSYLFITRVKGAVRLAWIGSYGAVEHYTFPATNSLSLLKSGALQYEIESAYEPYGVVNALAEILSSEKLWLVEGEEYTEVELLSDVVVLNKNGELSTVEYKIERYD